MFLTRYKNLIIAILICLSLYQTYVLWFDYFSTPYYSSGSGKSNTDDFSYFDYMIKDININIGNNRFCSLFTDQINLQYKSVFDNALKNTVENGDFSGEQEEYTSLPAERGSIVYELGCNFNFSDISDVFNINGKLKNSIAKFNRIEVIPDNNMPKSITVIFADVSESAMCSFVLKNSDIVTDYYDVFSNMSFDDINFYKESDEQNINLIPKWNGGFFKYYPIKKINPIESESGILLMSLENNVNIFFENPALKRTSIVNNVYTYTDENTVVKYYTNGILEYSDYSILSSAYSTENVYESYINALKFIKNDTEIKNDYYLSSIEKSGSKIKFGFDYKINNFTAALSEEYKKELGINNFIEVTVLGNNITKYTRLIYNLETDNENAVFANINSSEIIKRTDASALDLLYILDKDSVKSKLKWFINGEAYEAAEK